MNTTTNTKTTLRQAQGKDNPAEITLSKESLNMLAKLILRQDVSACRQIDKWGRALFDLGFVLEVLLCTILEKMGYNPLDICDTLLQYEVYMHGSILSDIEGLRVESGNVVDKNNKPVPGYAKFYYAQKLGKSFLDVQNEWNEKRNAPSTGSLSTSSKTGQANTGQDETDERDGSGV